MKRRANPAGPSARRDPSSSKDSREQHRLFFAAPVEGTLRAQVQLGLVELSGRGMDLPGRPVSTDHWHWTLRFVGDCSPRRSRALVQALESADLPEALALTAGGLGAFPAPKRARVLWVGPGSPAQAAALTTLAAHLDAALAAELPQARRSPFHPHLTLARLRPPADVRPLLDAWRAPAKAPTWLREVRLYRSHLGHGPPRYELLALRRLPDNPSH